MNALTKTQSSDVPTPIPLSLDYCLGKLANRLTEVGMGHEIMVSEAPTQSEREHLELRLSAVSLWLSPCDAEHLVNQVTDLMAVRPGQFGEGRDRRASILIFCKTLHSLPRFALDKAFQDAHEGRLGGSHWIPTPGDIHVAATKHLAALAREKAKIEAVLNAKVTPEKTDQERRRAVIAMAMRACKDMGEAGRKAEEARKSAEAAFRSEEARVERERLAAEAAKLTELILSGATDPRPMPKLDPTILAKFPHRQGAS